MSELMLDVGQANEIKMAFRREGPWTNEEIKMMCERKGFLTQVRQALLGQAEINVVPLIPAKPRSIFQHQLDLDKHDFPGMAAFAVDAFYKVNMEDESAKVKFSFLGPNFKNWFGGMKVKATKPSKLTLDKLISSAYDKETISEIGEKYCDLSLGELRWLFESGLLRKNGWYACYAKDKNGVRRAVLWLWGGGGWRVHAREVPRPDRWGGGDGFVSRKRLEAQVA